MKRAVLSWIFLACLFVPAALAGDEEELKATFERAVKALNARNLDGFLATVHPKSLSFYSCGPTSHKEGKDACAEDWQKFFQYAGTANFNADSVQVRVIGSTGIVWGAYAASVKSKKGEERSYSGRYSLIYTKEDGKWFVVWQENSPAPGS